MSTPSPLTQAAKAIRAAIKAATENGELPAYPDGAKIRVRSRRAALMSVIDIDIENVSHSWAYTGGGLQVSRPSPANLLLREALQAIAARHYQANGDTSFINVQVHLEED